MKKEEEKGCRCRKDNHKHPQRLKIEREDVDRPTHLEVFVYKTHEEFLIHS